MTDLTSVEGFQWDAGNARKSAEKHSVSQREAEQVFFNEPLLVLGDFGHSTDETRLHALRRTDTGRHLHITLTLREGGRLIRVISARPMHRKERAQYDRQTQDDPDIH